MQYDLHRFLDAQEHTFDSAFREIKNGKKEGHWMWFIFPQIAGLGFSETSRFYSVSDIEEAGLYLNHPILGQRLISISRLLTGLKNKTAYQVFGSPDDMKLSSCMTLFCSLINTDPVFQQVLDIYFDGEKDKKTLKLLI
jgi:uncharacterized protein (DUF1810 family)